MNTEDFVTYDQALALKKLGFDWKCLYNYSNRGTIFSNSKGNSDGWGVYVEELECSYNKTNRERVDAPTLAQAQKWLRKEKRYSVEELYDCDDKWSYFIVRMSDGEFIRHVSDFNSPEEALSAGITECLKLLNK